MRRDTDQVSVDATCDRYRTGPSEELQSSIWVAGGKKKKAAILAALREGWIDVLITERRTGEALLSLLLIEPVMRRNLYWE